MRKRPPVCTSASVIRPPDLRAGNPWPSRDVLICSPKYSRCARGWKPGLCRGDRRLLCSRATGTGGGAGAGGPLGFTGGIVRAALELSVLSLSQYLRLPATRAGIVHQQLTGGGWRDHSLAAFDEATVGIAGAADEAPKAPLAVEQRLATVRADAALDHVGRVDLALHVAAFRITGAGDEGATFSGARDQRLAAFRAHLAGRLRGRRLLLALATLDVIALGIEGAADEFAEFAHAVDETAVASFLLALRAVLAGLPHGDLHARRGLGFGQRLGERGIKLADDGHPLAPPLLHVIELLLHPGGEGDVDDVRKMLHQPGVDRRAQVGWGQPALFLLDVMTRLDDLDGWRKGARPAHAQLLERLDQGGFRVARWRLREVLLGLQLPQVERLVDGQRRQLPLRGAVASALPDAIEAIEDQHRAVRPEEVVGGADIDARLGEARRGHLAGREALPDQPIQPEQVGREIGAERIRCAFDVGRPDRLVRILDRALGLELHLVAASIGRPVLLGDEASSRRARIVRDAEGGGAHVRDQAHGPLAAELDAFVELLRQAHRPVRLHPQPVRCILLQRARFVGRRRIPHAVFGLNREHLVAGAFELRHDLIDLAFFGEVELFLAAQLAVQTRAEDALRQVDLGEHRVERPRFDRNELFDLLFPLADQPDRDRLHAARAQALSNLLPEQGAQLVADQPVDHAASLLRVDEILIHRTQRVERLFHSTGRNLVQLDPLWVLQVENVRKMPGDRLALAVRVRCQQDFGGAFGGGLQILDRRFLARDRDVFRLEGMLDVDPKRALRQVAHVTHRGANVVFGTKKPAKRFGLRGRFNDDQWVCHVRLVKRG